MIVFDAFPGPPGLTIKGVEHYSNLKNMKAILRPEQYPRLVMFRNMDDPKTVTPVLEMETGKGHPYTIKSDNFEKLFGEGVRLKEITIEMTDKPVTWAVRKYLPWLEGYYSRRLDGNRFGTINTDNPVANSLASGSFSTGENRNEH